MIEPMGQPDIGQSFIGNRKRFALAQKLKGKGNIFPRRHRWNKVERLKDNADMLTAQPRQRVFA